MSDDDSRRTKRSESDLETDASSAQEATGSDTIASDRRRLLKLSGVAAASVSTAGCNFGFGDGSEGSSGSSGSGTNTTEKPVESRSEAAGTVGLTASGVVDLGYPTGGIGPAFTDSSQVIYEGPSTEHIIQLDEHRFSLRDADIPLDLIASPSAMVDGRERNPVLSLSLHDHVATTEGRFGVSWLESTGVVSGSFPELKSTVSSVSPSEYAPNQNPSFLGSETEYEVFEVEVGPSSSSDQNDFTKVHIALARVTDDSDGIIVGTAVGVPATSGSIPKSRLAFIIERAMPNVTRDPDSSFPVPEASIEEARLVQTVSDTKVVNRNPVYEVEDPDLILGDHVAPLFSVGGSNTPAQLYCEASGTPAGTDRFQVTQGALAADGDLGDVASGFEAARRGERDAKAPSPFVLDSTTGSVDLSVEAPCGTQLDTTTISQGQDYTTTTSPGTMRVGFIACDGPMFLGTKQYSDTTTYERTVDLAVQYLRRVFPGEIYAYRHDTRFTGNIAVGQGTLPVNYPPFLGDAGAARNILESRSRSIAASPSNGELYAPGGSTADASTAIQNNGFNAWVLITPDGYYDYHNLDAVGKTPFVPKDNSKVPYNWFAATALEQAGRPSDQATAMTVAHELGHFFGGMTLYQVGPNDRPLAQRDDRGQMATINGEPVDFSHARHPTSDNDGDGNTDDPGIESLAFDFTGGTFRHVQNFSINPRWMSNVADPGMEISPPNLPPQGAPNTVESYMSYRNGRSLWSDAHLHQYLIDAEWSQATAQEITLVAQQAPSETADGSGLLQFDNVRVQEDSPIPDGLEGPVQVTMRSPTGATLATRQVLDTVTVSETNDEIPFVTVRMPFPEQAVEFVAVRDGEETRFNAIVRPLRDAVDRVPDRGFTDDPEASRDAIAERLDVVAQGMEERAFGQAADDLSSLSELLADTIVDNYESKADEPSLTDLSQLVERMAGRLDGLAEGG